MMRKQSLRKLLLLTIKQNQNLNPHLLSFFFFLIADVNIIRIFKKGVSSVLCQRLFHFFPVIQVKRRFTYKSGVFYLSVRIPEKHILNARSLFHLS